MLTFFKKVAKIQFSFVCHTNFVIFYYLALTGHLTQCVKTLSLFRDRAKKTDNIVTKAVTTIRNRVWLLVWKMADLSKKKRKHSARWRQYARPEPVTNDSNASECVSTGFHYHGVEAGTFKFPLEARIVSTIQSFTLSVNMDTTLREATAPTMGALSMDIAYVTPQIWFWNLWDLCSPGFCPHCAFWLDKELARGWTKRNRQQKW